MERTMWSIELYQKENGEYPVKAFLQSLSVKHEAKVLRAIDLLQDKGIELQKPHAEHVEGKIWELRVLFSGDIQRVFYLAARNRRFVLLHGFTKKTKHTPSSEKAIARNYYQDYVRRNPDEL
jgi:phage-related protein